MYEVGHGASKEESDGDECEYENSAYSLFKVSSCGYKTPPLRVTMQVSEVELQMEFDTGASASVISEKTYRKLWPENPPVIKDTKINLCTYTGELLDILGVIEVAVEYQGQRDHLPLIVVSGAGPTLLGRDWLLHIRLDCSTLNHLDASTPSELQEVLSKHSEAFRDELGKVTTTKATIHVDEKAQPRFYKPRPVPYAMRSTRTQISSVTYHSA